ncbi:MAG TPA: MarR family winged helix-turn-helix transcriptional regulator [Thermodesulfobacteriota bacterium]|nr:MarR family winged helix-turn-helix transcriptional regulator [Thermodesulfobacteriota bacterium]
MDNLELAKCTECACFNLRKATRVITQLYDKALRPTGLRATQFSLLVAVKMFGQVTVTRLAKMGVMDRTTLTRNLKPLEKQGLINIESGEDKRERVVTITPKGIETLAKALPLWEKAQTRVIKGLGQERWSSVLNNLSEMVSLAKQG